jgi:hypothetical protein
LILNGKENKEASAICFEIRIPKKKNEELLRKVPSKIYEVISLWKKNLVLHWTTSPKKYCISTGTLLRAVHKLR